MTEGCKHLGEAGVCQGMYRGFGCIQDRCAYLRNLKDAARDEPCEHLVEPNYCSKYHRFYCAGPSSCDTHVSYMEKLREKA